MLFSTKRLKHVNQSSKGMQEEDDDDDDEEFCSTAIVRTFVVLQNKPRDLFLRTISDHTEKN